MRQKVHLARFTVFAIAVLLFINLVHCSDTLFSVIYVISAVMSSYSIYVCSKRKLSIFFFFIVTYHLFLGGRFFAHLFNTNLDVFQSTFWYVYELKYAGKVSLMNWILGFLFFVVFGYLITNIRERKVKFECRLNSVETYKVNKFLYVLFLIMTPYVVLTSIKGLISAMTQGYGAIGYVIGTEYNIGYIDKFANLLLIAFTGLAMAYGDKKIIIRFFILFAIKGIFSLLGGSRGTIGSVLFTAIWAYSIYKPINYRKLFWYAGIGFVAILLLFSISVRGKAEDMSSLSFFDAFSAFLYTNGISLMVFDVSTKVDGYPLLPYFQTFITGANFIYSLFSGVHLESQNITFQGYLCYNLSPDLYTEGYGLGWTTNGDLFLFSGRIFVIYCIESMLLGAIFCIIDQWSRKSHFFLYFAASMAPALFLMARGSLAALFPQIVYSYLFFFIVKRGAQLFVQDPKIKNNENNH